MPERNLAQLGGVGHRDHPARRPGRGTLHGRLGQKVRGHASLDVDATDAHDEGIESKFREGALGQAADQGQFARTDFSPRKEQPDTGAPIELEHRAQRKRHHGHTTVAEGPGDLHGGGAPVQNDRLPFGQEIRRGTAYGRLLVGVLQGSDAVGRLLGAEVHADGATMDPPQSSDPLEGLEVPAHGHLGAVEFRRQRADLHLAVLLQRLQYELMPNVHIHSDCSNIYFVSSHTEVDRHIDAVVFDLGGVLLDWDPRNLYRKLFADEERMEFFLREVCTPQWHDAHDRGVPTAASCAELATRYPEWASLIAAWAERGEEMVAGPIEASVDVLRDLEASGLPRYALTNMEAETYPLRLQRFEFLGWFDGTVVSGLEGIAKPDPEIFLRLLDRFGLTGSRTLMIDDRLENLVVAEQLGMPTIHFHSSQQLRDRLESLWLLRPRTGRRKALSSQEGSRFG